MRAGYDAALWLVTAALVAAAILFAVQSFDATSRDGAYLVIASGALAAASAFFANGLTGRPILALSVPMLAGWWAATSVAYSLDAALGLAALSGLIAGALIGAVATTPARRTAAITLALAVLADLTSDAVGFAFDHTLGAPTIDSGAWIALLALAAIGLGWRAEGSLAAGLLAPRPHGGAAALGIGQRRLLALSGAIGGTAGGIAGALLAISASGPPDVVTGLVLAAAALAAGGTMAGTLALVTALWVLPQLALRATPTAIDLQLWLAGGVAIVVLVLGLAASLPRREHG